MDNPAAQRHQAPTLAEQYPARPVAATIAEGLVRLDVPCSLQART